MLTPFPELLSYGIIAPCILRVVVGLVFLFLAQEHIKHRADVRHSLFPLMGKLAGGVGWLFAAFEIVIALSLIAGFYTQIGALLGIIASLKFLLVRPRLHALAPLSRATYMLMAVVLLSLLLSGAGAFAFDLPL